MPDRHASYYRKRLTKEHLELLLAEDGNEAEKHRIKASFYERKLEELGERYDPLHHRFEQIEAIDKA